MRPKWNLNPWGASAFRYPGPRRPSEPISQRLHGSCPVCGRSGASAFTFGRFGPWNQPTWTIPVFAFCYLCYPLLAPRLHRLQLTAMRTAAHAAYALYIALALAAFAGVPSYLGWAGGNPTGRDFASAYNLAPVNLPVWPYCTPTILLRYVSLHGTLASCQPHRTPYIHPDLRTESLSQPVLLCHMVLHRYS